MRCDPPSSETCKLLAVVRESLILQVIDHVNPCLPSGKTGTYKDGNGMSFPFAWMGSIQNHTQPFFCQNDILLHARIQVAPSEKMKEIEEALPLTSSDQIESEGETTSNFMDIIQGFV